MKKIVHYPDPILRVVTPEIVEVDKKLVKDVADLHEVLVGEKQHAAGLAAVQLGMKRRFFGLIMGQKREVVVFINPQIVKTFGEKVRPTMKFNDGTSEMFLEGCLSFPNLFGEVKRYLKIEASWQEISNHKLITKSNILDGIEAIAYQHELDHLNGILFIDHIKEQGGEFYRWVGKEKIKWDVEKVVEEEK